MFKKTLKYLLITLAVLMMLGLEVSYAQVEIPLIPKAENLPGPGKDLLENKSARSVLVEKILPNLAVSLIGVVAAASLLFLVVGGVRLAMLYGNEEGIENAKNQIMYSLIGLIIAILAYTIVTIIVNFQFEKNQTPTEAPQGPLPQPEAAIHLLI